MKYVALLRGINVGGNKMVSMAELREVFEKAGFTGVKTLLQSGNVIFQSKKKPVLPKVGDVEILLRSATEWDAIVERNPFPKEAKSDPARLVVIVLKDAASQPLDAPGREVIKADGKQLYIYYPDGQGTTKLTNALIERRLGTRGTARNWNTVMKIANELMSE